MFRHGRRGVYAACLGSLLAAVLVPTTGCVGLVANLLNVAQGNLIPAKFEGLEEHRVAVVCVSNSESFGPTTASVALARDVGKMLQQNVRKIQLIDPQTVADWIDKHGWDYLDYVALGKGVNAEMLVAIDLDSFSLHEGRNTLQRPRRCQHHGLRSDAGWQRGVCHGGSRDSVPHEFRLPDDRNIRDRFPPTVSVDHRLADRAQLLCL